MNRLNPFIQSIIDFGASVPDEIFLVADKHVVTYGELCTRLRSAVLELKKIGVGKGDRIVLSAPNSVEFVYGYFATHIVGGITVPVSPRTGKANIDHIVGQVQPKYIFADEDFHYASRNRFPIEQIGHGEICEDTNFPEIDDVEIDDVIEVLFTTGTTNRPKGVVHTVRSILAAARNINSFIGNSSQDREVVPLPLSHSFGLGRLRCNILTGGTIILTDGFMPPGRIFQALDRWEATGLACVPAGFSMLFRLTKEKLGEYADQIRYIEIGSAPMERTQKEWLMNQLPNTRICMHYGLTEASRSTFIEFHSSREKLSSIGKPSPNVQVGILGQEHEELASGEAGEICIRAETVMKEYWNDPVGTEKVLMKGWLHTRDLGYRDAEGFIHLLGRQEEVVNVGGFKVAPVEVEECLKGYDIIGDCACVGIPDPKGIAGEIIKVYVVALEGERVTDKDIVNFLRDKIEPYKIPKEFEYIAKIPRTESGKIIRHELNK